MGQESKTVHTNLDNGKQKMRTVFLNGKFTAQRTTGVQRMALQLVKAIDRKLYESKSDENWVLICPPGSSPPNLSHISIELSGPKFLGLHMWEQCYLPLRTIGQTLINLTGSSPLVKLRQACMIPDAAVFDHPRAYKKLFIFWYRFLFRVTCKSARLLLTISEYSKRQIVGAMNLPTHRLKIIHCAANHMNGVVPDLTVIQNLKLSNTQYYLAVASRNPTKNLEALITAFCSLEDKTLRLVLVGGENPAIFKGKPISDLSDFGIVNAGKICDSKLAALYLNAKALVFPSIYEGFGLPLVEAMILKCPVVAARAASIPEVCEDAALYFDPNSPSDIALAMSRVMNDSALRNALIFAGELRVNYFDWNKSADQLIQYLMGAGLIPKNSALV